MKRAILLVAVACQSHEAPPRVETGSSALQRPMIDAGSAGSAIAEPDVPDVDKQPKHEEPEQVDPGKQLVELGAIPAWQAVVDRTLYLERRGQKGVVYGTLDGSASEGSAGSGSAAEPSPYTWLVDDTEGSGSLAIRAKLPAPRSSGDRVALAGAWTLDDARHWFWHVTNVTALSPSPSKFTARPSHTIENGELPAGVRPISKAQDDDAVYFTLVGAPPVLVGDGWPVADQLGDPVAAILNLPGEHASYGAQDMRAPDERWTLKRGQTYWVRVGVVHKHGLDKPMTMTARTAPIRVQ
ncbi:MAG TPA: hypothetical protein VGG74_09155 [Kofleriaceae bacterium]